MSCAPGRRFAHERLAPLVLELPVSALVYSRTPAQPQRPNARRALAARTCNPGDVATIRPLYSMRCQIWHASVGCLAKRGLSRAKQMLRIVLNSPLPDFFP